METIDTVEAFRAAADAHEGFAASALACALGAAVDGLRSVSTGVSDYRALDETTLLSLNTLTAEAARLTQTHAALIAGEIARRSAPELGSQGLAQRAGHRNAENFVKVTTGSSGRQATTAVRAGLLMAEMADEGSLDTVTGEVFTPSQPWLREITSALTAGEISVEAADAISFNLGLPNSAVTGEQLGALATELCDAARVRPDGIAGMDVDHLVKMTRMRREELDLEGVKLREDEQYEARAYKLIELPTGAGRLILELDPESMVLVKQTIHRAVSPKLRTVRFFDPTEKVKAETILADTRTPAQLGFDAIIQLLLLGAAANPGFLMGSGAPQIRVTTTLKALQSADGIVRVEGSSALMSMRTLKRLQCSGGVTALIFDENLLPLDVGREHRLFTTQQRTALAVKWGGCAIEGCDAEVSWTEAHHIDEWAAENGKTNVADGILLCKPHHLLIHNNGWHINRNDQGDYWLVPPPSVDPDQTPRLLQPKTGNMRDLRNEQQAGPEPPRGE
ncbi:MAG: hypothetical protein QOH69_2131 [Actinomycetota bacterium]|jgi:hypothetical protein|nr:hypothetical protein [Actinomycetota bacterium]